MTDDQLSAEQLHLLVAAYALDAVDDIERAQFERHLATCESCQAELDEMRATLGRLAEADSQKSPVGMRNDVMARIANTAQLPPHTTAQPVEIRKYRRSVRILGAVAAALAIGVAGVSTYAYEQHRTAQTMTASAQMVTDVMTASDAHIKPIDLGNSPGSVVMSSKMGQAVLVAQNVPQLPANQTYETWMITPSGEAHPAGMWTPSSSGTTAVPIEGDIDLMHGLSVTVEPSGGSAQPTSPPLGSVTMF